MSRPEALSYSGGPRRVVFTCPVGGGTNQISCTVVPDTVKPGDVPEPLSLCLTDSTGGIFLSGVQMRVPFPAEEVAVDSVNVETDYDGIGEVIAQHEAREERNVYYCSRALADEITQRLAQDGAAAVRVQGNVATRIATASRAKALPDWLSFPDVSACPPLGDMAFPPTLRRAWERDCQAIADGRPIMMALFGPTGVGKTESSMRCACEAGRRSGKPVAFLRLSPSHVCSIYHSQSETNLRLALGQARKLAAEGHVVVVLVDEADAMLGNSSGRWEGGVDRRIRSTFQELTSKPIPGVAIYLTFNVRKDSWVDAAIDRRFGKREFPPATRGQIAAVAAMYATPAALAKLDVTAEEFGALVADFLYSRRFVVAHAQFASGQASDILANQLQICCPGKVQMLVESFCGDVEAGVADSIDCLLVEIEREFLSMPLNARNVHEFTFLPETHDPVASVERPPKMRRAAPHADGANTIAPTTRAAG